MSGKETFLLKLKGLVEIAHSNGNKITIEEVTDYFSKEVFPDTLTEEQMELVFDYLLAQRVAVQGYVKVDTSEQLELTEEEKTYLKEYLIELDGLFHTLSETKEVLIERVLQGDDTAKPLLIEHYLQEVVEIAKTLNRPEVFLGDLIQEGNLGIVLGVELISDVKTAHEVILSQIRQSMQLLLEESQELSSRDKKMIEKVSALDEAIKNLTEELGRKVSIDELAIYMGMEIKEIEDILKLTGEEPGDTQE